MNEDIMDNDELYLKEQEKIVTQTKEFLFILENQNEIKNKEIKSLKKSLKSKNDEIKSLEKSLESKNDEIKSLEKSLESKKKQIKKVEKKNKKLLKENEEIKSTITWKVRTFLKH